MNALVECKRCGALKDAHNWCECTPPPERSLTEPWVASDNGSGKREAAKNDIGKPPLHLLPFEALWAVARVLDHGRKIHAVHNWRKGLEWSRWESAMLRHYAAYQTGEDVDPDSGLLHTAHIACNALFLLAHQLCGLGTDDRYKSNE